MGTKTRSKVSLFVALLVALSPMRCEAASVSELYQFYGKDFVIDVPEEITSTISAYDGAKKYVSMYNYVVNSEYDQKELDAEYESLLAEKDSLENTLLSGLRLKQTVLYELEDRYAYVIQRISDIEQSKVTFETDDVGGLPVNVPTYSEYTAAKRERDAIHSTLEIGSMEDLMVPAQSSAKLLKHDESSAEYRVVDGTGVLSTFNGVVEDILVDKDYGLTIVVNNGNGAYTYFCNLEIVDVQIGDTVYQNQRLGYVYGSKLILRLQLDDEFMDVSELFGEE